ncbi:hypothetical protein KH388_22240 [Serratia rubidaea]|nr:hypothetical protein [Serratia rubidaea]
MASTPNPVPTVVSEEIRQQIHFDTLWSTAQAALQVYAGQRWSARGDDDPGVTLLQALTYGVSDISYRYTLPLTDLLTEQAVPNPVDNESPRIHLDHNDGIFAHEFGPEQALTSSPVTLEDYRRALLDLTVGGEGTQEMFCFRDVQIAPCPATDSYGYTCDSAGYALQFLSQTTPGARRYRVSGSYRVWVTLMPGISENDVPAVLDPWLKNHRNLCEWEIIPQPFVKVLAQAPAVQLILDDDLPEDNSLHQAVAEAIWAINQALLPLPARESAAARLEREPAEQIYTGPQLVHGWISTLPAPRQTAGGALCAFTLPLQALSAAASRVPGIGAVTWEGTVDPITVLASQQVQLWIDATTQRLDRPSEAIQIYKHGQLVSDIDWAVVGGIYLELLTAASQARVEPLRHVPYGRYRHPGFYRTVGASLPPLFGLQQAKETFAETNAENHDARQLLLFLRSFEQLLADRADQLKKVPCLLAFDGRDPDAMVWGAADWPVENDDPLAAEQTGQVLSSKTRARLQWLRLFLSQDNEKELAIVDYLLGYFGERRAPRALNADSRAFRHVQQGFLRQVTRLAYERSAISISRISALQRKVAARLGVGAPLFDERLQQPGAAFPSDTLPFYVIEHQEMLPVAPAPESVSADWPGDQSVSHINVDKQQTTLTLGLAGKTARSLQPGQLIELQGTQNNQKLTPLAALVIHTVEKEDDAVAITIQLDQHTRLKRSLRQLENTKDYRWQWRVAQTWLKRVVYDLVDNDGHTRHTADIRPTRTLRVMPSFPAELVPGQRFALRPKGRWHSWPTHDDLMGNNVAEKNDVVVEVVSADPVRGTVTVKWIAQVQAVIADTPPSVNAVDLTLGEDSKPDWGVTQNSDYPYAWSVPYVNESFSFTLSLVLDRQWLKGSKNPGELNRWIEQIVREEMPSHLNLQLHWLDDFNNFASKYRTWQNDGRPVGDQSYELLRLLGIGERPVDTRAGIGFVRVVGRTESDSIESKIVNDKNKDKALQQEAVVYVRGAETADAIE